MPPRIAYWTSAFEGGMEAVANEVDCLRKAFPESVAWGVCPGRGLRLSRQRGYSVPPRLQLAFRAVTWWCQRSFDIQHLFGSLGDWFHLRAVHRRPTLLTQALAGSVVDSQLLAKVDRFVVEWPAAKEHLQGLGIEPQRIDVVLPPVDIDRFQPRPMPDGATRLLFCSSPDRADWLDARGVPQLIDLAARRSDVRVSLLWRPWGNSLPEVQRLIEASDADNVELHMGRFDDMALYYQQAHIAVALFTDASRCKPVPNSLLEGMACGRPVITTPVCGLAAFIERHGTGIVCQADPAAVSEAIDQLRANWADYSLRARKVAESHFAEPRFVAAYRNIYTQLLSNPSC